MIGFLTRLVAIPLAIDMLAAMFLVSLKNGFFVSQRGVELELLLFAGSLAMVLGGPGALSIDRVLSSARSRSVLGDSLP
jgi:putative oxidoreductase